MRVKVDVRSQAGWLPVPAGGHDGLLGQLRSAFEIVTAQSKIHALSVEKVEEASGEVEVESCRPSMHRDERGRHVLLFWREVGKMRQVRWDPSSCD